MSDSDILMVGSYSLAAVGYGFLFMLAIGHQRRLLGDPASGAIAIASLVTVAWAVSGVAHGPAANPVVALAYEYLDIVRYGAWYGVLIGMLTASGWTRMHSKSSMSSQLVLGMTATLLIVGCVAIQVARLSQWATTDLLVQAYLYAGLALAAFGLLLLEQLFRCSSEDSRWNLKPLAIALGAGFAFDIYLKSSAILFLRQDPDAFAIRGLAHLLVLPLLVLFISRSRSRRILVSLSKSAVFHTTTLAAVGIYLFATAAAGYYIRYIGGSWGGALRIALLFSAFVVLVLLALSGTVRARIRVFVGKHFFRYRYDYREEWLKFTEALSSEATSGAIGLRVVRVLADMVESPAGALWVAAPTGNQYVMTTHWNVPVSTAVEPADSSFSAFLRNTQWILDLEDFRLRPGRYDGLALPSWLSELPNAWLVLPLRIGTELNGFVVLATARVPLDVNWEVNDLLKTASLQAAAFLAQVQTTEALLEARKFDAFNRMSAFVVHDLKNIVAQLSLLLRNAERHRENADFQRDMLSTIQHSVDKMRQLMLQLREGTKPSEAAGRTDLADIVRRVKAAKASSQPQVEVEILDHAYTRGHADRIERVLGHLVQNAIDATPADGRVWITVGRDQGSAMVEVADTGVGMTEEFLREKLFKPFSTTKSTGMGIGAYESMHYVQELGGRIDVHSSPGTGTKFIVRLPLLDVTRESGLVDREKS